MKFIIYVFFFLVPVVLGAQTPAADSVVAAPKPLPKKPKKVIVKRDSSVAAMLAAPGLQDSVSRRPADTMPAPDMPFKPSRVMLTYKAVVNINPYFNFSAAPENLVSDEHIFSSKDALFYIMAGLLFFFAVVRRLFNKYMGNLLGLVFRGSLRQKQIREQLLQTPLPSLLLNIFFVLVAGLYVFFLLQHYQTMPTTGFWLLLLYCVLSIGVVYLLKFVILKATGWIFNMREAADTYIFIVFLVNKLLAIFLLPLLIMMTFSLASWASVLLTLSYVMVVTFFAYRYIVSFAPVRREVKVSQFHFFMYLCAFEIIPLLLIYKVLSGYF